MAGTESTLTAWQTAYSKDTHSLKATAGVVTPPTLVTHTPGTPDAAGVLAEADAIIAALQLATGSAALNVGASVNVYRDYLDNVRPVGAARDIGAFEKQ